MGRIIATVGLPYSGKSSWCDTVKQFADLVDLSCEIVCRDDIRKEVFSVRYDPSVEDKVSTLEEAQIVSFAENGVSVILVSACHHREEYRERLTKIAHKIDYSLTFVHIETSKEDCIARAKAANDLYIIPVIEKKVKEWESLD